MPEALLGFDARVVGPLSDAQWTPERHTYLLRDVARPLSVDTLVWPTAFKAPAGADNAPPAEVGWIPRPEWIGPNDAWDSLPAMDAALAAGPPPPPGNEVWKVALTWHSKDALVPGHSGPHAEPTTPRVRDASWKLLGYDVADPSISGLSNCGYDEDEKGELAPTWAPRLNEYHLFANLEDAYGYLEVTDARVEEHAPFFVIGLWRVP